MSKVRVCFLGTPDFAVPSLKQLIEDEHFELVGVVTQPDRPAGRKLVLTPCPVKVLAQSQNIRVISPESVNDPLMLQEIQRWGAEVAVVVAFGQILSEEFLNSFIFGAVNIHASLLPRWRGAAPIQRAVENGDTETGVTLQKIVKKLDAGDILGVRKVPLDQNITAKELHDELALLGAELLHVELMDYVRGNLAPTPQDESSVCFAKKIDKAEALVDWKMPANKIHNKVRALTFGPGAYTLFRGKKLKIHRSRLLEESTSGNKTGEVVRVSDEELIIQTGQGCLGLLELQPESRSRMKAGDFNKGYKLQVGEVLGE